MQYISIFKTNHIYIYIKFELNIVLKIKNAVKFISMLTKSSF